MMEPRWLLLPTTLRALAPTCSGASWLQKRARGAVIWGRRSWKRKKSEEGGMEREEQKRAAAWPWRRMKAEKK